MHKQSSSITRSSLRPTFHNCQELRGTGRPGILSHAEEVRANLSELRISGPEPTLTHKDAHFIAGVAPVPASSAGGILVAS